MKRSRGYLSKKTRRLKAERKLTVNDHLKHFSLGEKVLINQKPYYKGAMPHMRYRNKVAEVIEKRGSHYVLRLIDGNKEKILISHPVHLEKIKVEESDI